MHVKKGMKYSCAEGRALFFSVGRATKVLIHKKKKGKKKQNKHPPPPIFCGVKTLWALLTSHLQLWVRRGSEICCLLTSFKRVSFKNLFMVGEDMPEKTFAHKTAVK